MLTKFSKGVTYFKFQSSLKLRRYLTKSCTGLEEGKELTLQIKTNIEKYWQDEVNKGEFHPQNVTKDNKFYVLSMFPYPSGNLHMGHVRVYTISDAMARYYRMNGKNVFHPIGWDAFGLPAENAAIERKIDPAEWTKQNIKQMREQLKKLGCSFDWDHEIATSHKEYYKWTQKLFLLMYEKGLAYQKNELVNWDPIDKTVLAHEQVDINGRSWRSGAKVEKKMLKQWFIKTTKFAKQLLDGLDDPILQEWRDIKNLQRHWIGECDGYSFDFEIKNDNEKVDIIRIWTDRPEILLDQNSFVVIKTNNHLAKFENIELQIYNPFNKLKVPIRLFDDVEFPLGCDYYWAAPSFNENDKILAELLNVDLKTNYFDTTEKSYRQAVIKMAKNLDIGGYPVSSKLKDWLISRQRFWGTPIPIIHCDICGAVPVKDENLPFLPVQQALSTKDNDNEILVPCPKCGGQAKREKDTMDTFVDSAWYYLRFLDPKNKDKIYDQNLIDKCMPVDLYIGGKEHAVLHLYYARFINHFLYSIGMSPHSEPFKRLLVQGMVMGQTFKDKKTGMYLNDNEVEIVDMKKGKAISKLTKNPVTVMWEKMSKSKNNGVDPNQIIEEYGSNTTRLILLADVAPTSHRNWSKATFPGILNWQKRLWLTINEFEELRKSNDIEDSSNTCPVFKNEDLKLYDARNYYVKGVTFNFKHSYQLSVGISKMQGLTNALRRAPKNVIKFGSHYETALAAQLIMLAPIAPHFASELWSRFCSTPNRINTNLVDIEWDRDVLRQKWPDIDMEYNLDFTVKINGFENCIVKIPRKQLDYITYEEAMDIAFNTESVTSFVTDRKIKSSNLILYKGVEAILNIYLEKPLNKEVKML
ncbi:leucine--tRNA ligase, mitochondrial [Condylostylus longicornis]|uniref:leucine--tRNA ligase, mitochondrial n=1 Tax=Condylostylus longicornis TaxID=2530218 RepID=UPI00244E40EC|nr:leucine--tRNA ligase, mitochondrial [Condylostylus longicornis]